VRASSRVAVVAVVVLVGALGVVFEEDMVD
jgi:hypothetical protein